MVFCPKCGAECPPDSVFCWKCGSKILKYPQKSQKQFDLSRLKAIIIPSAIFAIIILIILVFSPWLQDPCKRVICDNECRGNTLWKMKCIQGECVPDYPIEENSEICGYDPCKDIVCENKCFGNNLWKMKCFKGECVPDYMIEKNSTECGIELPPTTSPTPTPTPKPKLPGEISIKICTVHYNAPGDDRYNPNGEWVEICNTGTQDVNMSGWRLYDDAYINRTATDHVFIFPSGFILEAGKSVTVYTGEGRNTNSKLYFGRSPGDYAAIWNNDGDCAYLVDDQGTLVDTYCW